ncbi:MAG: dephospho-CoA kinase [Bryobacterales bacterium]|nr:dephospho-CoA kinase [Bryobacterales bacterium]
MLRVALTGGLASGKSTVGRNFEQLGCLLVKLDELGHQVLMRGGDAYDAVLAEFGPGVLSMGGTIDRKALAALVFGHPAQLEKLNRIVHPPVRRLAERILGGYQKEHPDGIAVVEAAIHIETGGYREYHCVVLAVCTPEQQMERAMHRDGATREDVLARLARQMPLEEKRKYADYVIDTSGTREAAARQTEAVYRQLLLRPERYN